MADVVYVNEEDGKKRVMNNGKLYARLLTKFKDGTNLDNLINSINAEDWENAKSQAHTIKGLAANLSLTELYNQSLDLESQAKEGAVDPGSLEKIKLCFQETLTEIDKVIARNV